MLLYVAIYNSVSQHSRNVYLSSKTPRKSIHGYYTSTKRQVSTMLLRQPKRLGQKCEDYLFRTNVPTNSLTYSAKYAYLLVRMKCNKCFVSVIKTPTRNLSNKHSWKTTLTEFLQTAHNSLALSVKVAVVKPTITAQHHIKENSPKMEVKSFIYFSEDDDKPNKSAEIRGDFDKTLTVLKEERKINTTAAKDNWIKNKKENFDKEPEEKKVTRSQYENLATSLSKQSDEDTFNENSVFTSVKSLMETPVNSFFSFLSRTTSRQKSTNISLTSDQEKNENFSNKDKLANASNIHEHEIIQPPPSLLEILYQYIPYVPGKKDITKLQQMEVKKKDFLRIKAEKDKLTQRVAINNRTRYLIQTICEANSLSTLSRQVEELCDHLLKFPDTRITAVKDNAIREITHIYRTTYDHDLLPTLRKTLAMLGAVDPPKHKGIRVLTIDGGGSRGLLSVEILRRLVELSGRPIHEMFDYICGVSTGAILGFLLGIKKVSIEDLSSMYRELSSEIFNQNRLVGTGALVFSHSYYDTETYQEHLRKIFGDELLIETAAYEDVPKCSAVSTLVNRLALKPFVWRNYSIVPGTRITQWNGTCRGTMWEAIRASSAAPGYFEEFKRDSNIHQDGGVLTNNPTGVALHECRLLWPNAPIQCVVSLGTGRYEPTVGPIGEDFLSLKDKLLKFVESATSVTEVHTIMHDLLPSRTYFRFNPFIKEPLLLDECRTEKLDLLVSDACEYIERNEYKFKACVDTLVGVQPFKMRDTARL